MGDLWIYPEFRIFFFLYFCGKKTWALQVDNFLSRKKIAGGSDTTADLPLIPI